MSQFDDGIYQPENDLIECIEIIGLNQDIYESDALFIGFDKNGSKVSRKLIVIKDELNGKVLDILRPQIKLLEYDIWEIHLQKKQLKDEL